jgi:hypothetical protein
LLAILERQPAESFAVEFEQVEGAKHGSVVVTPGPKQSKTARPLSSLTMASPSIMQECDDRPQDLGESIGEVVAIAGIVPHAGGRRVAP